VIKNYVEPGMARWWLRWWLDTRGPLAGVVLPAALAWLAYQVDARLVPLGLAVGLGVGLLWTASRAAAYALLGLALLLVLGVGLLRALLDPLLGLVAGLFLFAPVLLLVALLMGRRKVPQPAYHAHWATAEETRDMVVGGRDGHPPGDGVLLGVNHGRAIGVRPGFEGRREMGHVLVCGPNRSGKSLHLITNLMLWQDSAITLDIKGELYRLTAAKRKEMGNRVLVLDPSGRGDRYDPFAELSYSDEALMTAANIVMETEKERQPIFAQRAAAGVVAAALAAAVEGVPTLPYLRAITREGPMAFVRALARIDDAGVREKLIEFLGGAPEDMSPRDFREDRFLASTWSTMVPRLSPLLSQGVLKMTGGSDFRAADLVERPTSLYLMFRESELGSTRKVFQLVLLSLVTGLIRRGDLDPDEEGVPMLLALDEAGRTPIPRLDDLVSTISGRGMSALVYVQDLSQLESAYGRQQAQTIRGNCHTQVYYRPTEHDTAERVSRMTGKKSVQDIRVSSGGQHSEGLRERELITPDEVRQIPQDRIIAFTGKKQPIYAQRLEWFNLLPGASEFVKDNPLPEPPELPLPEVATTNGAGNGGSAAHADGGAKRRPRRTAEDPAPAGSEDGEERRRRGARPEREGGYVEPDV
jgi:type IV secretion system protein VirD4